MTNLQEVPTDELLSFHNYPVQQNKSEYVINNEQAEINISSNEESYEVYQKDDVSLGSYNAGDSSQSSSFWTLEYYQQFFNVDTEDVLQRILASILPRSNNVVKQNLRQKPDLYGPIWISLTLIFTIAISGNIANYLQHVNEKHHWRYDFRLVSYAATAIWTYITLIPISLWLLLKYTSDIPDLGAIDNKTPGALELICVYGYSLFIYIPVSALWCIQISTLQWLLVLIGALLSGSVLLLTLLPALRMSRHKLILIIAIIMCHLSLAAGFKLYFFHDPSASGTVLITTLAPDIQNVTTVKL